MVRITDIRANGIEWDDVPFCEVDDVSAVALAHDIVKKIEAELEYPGQIKVHVLRETKAVDYAK